MTPRRCENDALDRDVADSQNSPLNVVLASRKDTAVKLFEKANPVPKVEPATRIGGAQGAQASLGE